MASENILDLDATLLDSTIQSDRPVLIDFWAPWCGPCKAISPILEDLAKDMGDKVQICKVNVDDNQELAGKFNVRAIPTLLIFKSGELVDQIVGMTNQDAIKEKLSAQI